MKRLGQHFLKNKSAIKAIVDALETKPGDTIVEIGAGHGELTEKFSIFTFHFSITAIEKDPELATLLRKKFIGNDNVKIVDGDALKILPSLIGALSAEGGSASGGEIVNCKLKIVGNIPYYITGRLFRILSELPKKPEICVFTIQKEVAERIVAGPRRMNRLAAIIQFWAELKILRVVPREDFTPQPKVDSAIVALKMKNEKSRVLDLDYYKTVKTLFAQPRKTILNNLMRDANLRMHANAANKENIVKSLQKLGINPSDRPQNLSVEDITKISLSV